MERVAAVRRESTFTWKAIFKRALCAYIFKGHKFPPNVGKRSDLVCLRCNVIFYTTKRYSKGKR